MNSEVEELPHLAQEASASPIVSAYRSAYSTSLGRYVRDTQSPDTNHRARAMSGEEERRSPLLGGEVSSPEIEKLNVSGSSDSVGDTSDQEPAIKYEDCTGAAYRIRKGITRTPLQVTNERDSSGFAACWSVL